MNRDVILLIIPPPISPCIPHRLLYRPSSLLEMSRFRQQVNTVEPRPSLTEDVPRFHEFAAEDSASLTPPRPPFLTSADRSSWSSNTFSASSDTSDSDRERPPPLPMPHPPPLTRPASLGRLRKPLSSVDYTPGPTSQDIQESSNDQIFMRRHPPSSFAFPFLSHPGNPDPLPPRSLRRSSEESSFERPSSSQGFGDNDALPTPYAPFMGPAAGTPPSPASTLSHVFRNSVAGNLGRDSQTHLPRTSSTPTFRSPFLSPASRPSSTVWTPPIQPLYGTPDASSPQLGVKKSKPPMPSTLLSEKLTDQDKPWLKGQNGDRPRLSWWLTVIMWFAGLGLGALKVYTDYKSINIIHDSQLCPVFVENFDSLNLNDWTPDVELGGFGQVYLLLFLPFRPL